MIALIMGRLARTVAAQHRQRFAGAHVERDAVDDVAQAVAAGEVLKAQHQARPR
jgi:hypothetical protein